MQRRDFIQTCATFSAAMASIQLNALAFGQADTPDKNNIIIHIFLRGGCDALQLIAPVADRFYQDARAEGLKIKDSGSNKGINIANGLNTLPFALHGNAGGLAELYASGKLAIVHACGISNGTRSHFEAQDLMDLGIVSRSAQSQGWLSRYVNALGENNALIPAAHLGGVLPLSFSGSNKALALNSVADFNLKGDARLAGLIAQSYKQEKGVLGEVGRATLAALATIKERLRDNKKGDYQPKNGANYPNDNPLADNLRALAQIIKLDTGLRAASVDFGGWDTHDEQSWRFPRLVEKLSQAIAAFYNDMADFHQRLTLVVMSEFGRRLKSNKSEGTDHGHGGMALVLGGRVKGGKMYGSWLGLDTELLDHRVDLQVTTDYRAILAELIAPNFAQAAAAASIFPNFVPPKALGLL